MQVFLADILLVMLTVLLTFLIVWHYAICGWLV